MKENITRPTYMEVSIDNFNYNINKIKEIVGSNVKLMPVIKANGYGTYLNKRIDVLNMFEIVAVAIVDEGVYLRNIGYKKEIFVLNQPYIDEIPKIIKYNITVGVSSLDFIKELGKIKDKVNIHIEIGTGMGRTGIKPSRTEEFIKKIPSNVNIEGIYTHLSSADNDIDYTKSQLNSFNIAIKEAKRLLGDIKYIHAAASNAILNYKESHFNLVRPGIIIYGYPSSDNTLSKIDLKPVTKLITKITYLKEVEKGTSIGYNRSYITTKKTKVATIPIGYADGLRRILSNNFKVYVKGGYAPIIGNICMDSCMIDVTDIDNINIGDEVIIWDNTHITLEELAKKCNTINYEILCSISDRVPRIFK